MGKVRDHSVVREGDFQDYGTARIDAKHRLLIKGPVEEHYRVYRNESGQILLDPQVMIPAREAWLYRNKKALASVRRGVEQAAEGKGRYLGSFAKYAKTKSDE